MWMNLQVQLDIWEAQEKVAYDSRLVIELLPLPSPKTIPRTPSWILRWPPGTERAYLNFLFDL